MIMFFTKPWFLPIALSLLLFQILTFCGSGHSQMECVLKLS